MPAHRALHKETFFTFYAKFIANCFTARSESKMAKCYDDDGVGGWLVWLYLRKPKGEEQCLLGSEVVPSASVVRQTYHTHTLTTPYIIISY